MKYVTLVRENMKKHKGSFIGIFLLMFIITVSLSSVLSIWNNSRSYVSDEMERIQYGDLIYWMNNNGKKIDKIVESMEAVDGVDKVVKEDNAIIKIVIDGEEVGSSVFAYRYSEDHASYHVFDGDTIEYKESPKVLEQGEVYVPISYKALYDIKIGDEIFFKGYEKAFTVKGFFEDPADGSIMMGMKNVLISDADLKLFHEKQWKDMVYGCTLHVFKDSHSKLSTSELQRDISEKVSLKEYSLLVYSASSIATFMLILQNIFVGFLIGFVAILLIITIIVIGHSISTSIEQSYVDLGILKAIGFTKKQLCVVLSTQYLVTLLVALIVGVLASTFLVKLINIMILPSTGIKIPSTMPVTLIGLCFFVIMLIFTGFILLQVRKIGKVTPMTAIRGGKAEVYFDSRIHTKIHGRGLQFFLALRQLVTGKKQYLGAAIITALLVFTLAFCNRLIGWLGEDGSGLMNSMGAASVDGRNYDFAIYYDDESLQNEVEQKISETTPIIKKYQTKTMSAEVFGLDLLANIISNPEYLHIVDGRTCKYDNEIVVTQVVANEHHIKIGDKVKVGIENHSKEMIVSGINQCANDMGENISMGIAAYENIIKGESQYYQNYILEDKSKKDGILEKLYKEYDGKINIDDNTWSGIDGILNASGALGKLMDVICAIFVLIVVAMTGGKILYKEQQDLGIYKALGFHSRYLRISFSLRFLIVSVLGAAIGVVLSIVATDFIAGKIFIFMGVSNFSSPVIVPEMIRTVAFVVLMFFGFSYLISRRIRKTNPSILIVE